MGESDHRVAIIQHPPVLLDRAATLARAVTLIDEAVAGGARLVVLPETFIPGYPEWVWRVTPNDYATNGAAFAKLQKNSVDLATDDPQPSGVVDTASPASATPVRYRTA